MKRSVIIAGIFAALFFGFIVYYSATTLWHPGPSAIINYKNIEGIRIPSACAEFNNDVCALFDCMVDQCWCDDSSPELPILMEGKRAVSTEDEAMEEVRRYLIGFYEWEEGDMTGKLRQVDIKSAVKLNNVFYNVFVEVDNSGDEEVYTVAADGVIFKTICGV